MASILKTDVMIWTAHIDGAPGLADLIERLRPGEEIHFMLSPPEGSGLGIIAGGWEKVSAKGTGHAIKPVAGLVADLWHNAPRGSRWELHSNGYFIVKPLAASAFAPIAA